MIPSEILTLIINGGIAGIFAVFAIQLWRMTLKSLDESRKNFMEFLDEEKKQRREIMREAQRSIIRMNDSIDKLHNAIDYGLKDKPQK
jgi:hypothetical protein